MANFQSHENCSTKTRGSIFVFAVAAFVLINGIVDCRRIDNVELNSVMKTIKVDGGDVIDCVDIYKQPALNHPLLKNHTIQLNPPNEINETGNVQDNELFQPWLLNDECPEGTIPIVRTQAFNSSSLPSPKPIPQFNGSAVEFIPAPGHEYAEVALLDGEYYGAHANLNVWSPLSVNQENSFSQLWLSGGRDAGRSSVEAGWKINSVDGKTRLFIFWTGHNYKDGCYNQDCPGFVQVSRKVALGAIIQPISSYNGKQFEVFISIYKHQSAGQWWFKFQNEAVGYWPDSILPSLRGSGDVVAWGGEIFNSGIDGVHTRTQMGSGHFPSEGYGRASYIRNTQYLAKSGKFVDAEGFLTYVTKPSCYNLIIKIPGTLFYYGGPGYSASCPK